MKTPVDSTIADLRARRRLLGRIQEAIQEVTEPTDLSWLAAEIQKRFVAVNAKEQK